MPRLPPANGDSGENIVGVYQWLNKVYEAQVFNYGARTIYDLMVTEPAAFLTFAAEGAAKKGEERPPEPFTIDASGINEGTYRHFVALYGVIGVKPPLEPFVTIATTFKLEPGSSGNYVETKTVEIPENYEAIHAHVVAVFHTGGSGIRVAVLIGRRLVVYNTAGGGQSTELDGEVGSLPIGALCAGVSFATITVEVVCRQTTRAMEVWRNDTHSAIQQAYFARVQEYQEKLPQRMAERATQSRIAGRNPIDNQRIIGEELKKACITILTQQHFDAFNGVEPDSPGWPRIDLEVAADQGAYVRFFEQAFEWENATWVFYPYFWSRKSTWLDKVSFHDPDGVFAEFVRAGAARVSVPVRPDFEPAIEHFMLTGDIWSGGELPELTDPEYLPIAEEIRARTGAPANEKPVGEPWRVTVPTSLVVLRRAPGLPAWVKDSETGQFVPADSSEA